MHGIALAGSVLPNQALLPSETTMALIRILLLGVSVLVGAAATAEATLLTLNFSGNVDLSISGGPAVNPFSGFFTWDPARAPSVTDPGLAIYEVEAYQLIFNGVEKTH